MRTRKGIVTSTKMTGTATVTVHRHMFHPIYKKRFRRSKKFLADSAGIKDLHEGDTVMIEECRPMSKNKCFKITEVLQRVPRVEDIQEEEAVNKAIHREKIKEETTEPVTDASDTKSDSTPQTAS